MCPMNGSEKDLKGLKSDLGNKEERGEEGKERQVKVGEKKGITSKLL